MENSPKNFSTSSSEERKKILELIIDGQSYLFKLSPHQDFNYLKTLAGIVEKKIVSNKAKFSIKDYKKLLILSSLNLAEDILKLKKQVAEKVEPTSSQTVQDRESRDNSNLEILEQLENIKESLQSSLQDSDNNEESNKRTGEEK